MAGFTRGLRGTFEGPLKREDQRSLSDVKFWAFAHLLSNGMLADVLLFGGFLAWAVCDRISLKRRAPQTIRTAAAGRFNDLIAVVLGLALYVFFIGWAHLRLFGVSPLSHGAG